MADRIGQQLGHYHLTHLLGKGGFADVYLGRHIHLDTPAAIKVLHTELTSEDVALFRTEARNLARLIHPHIVRLLDFGLEENTPYLVMDYAPNGTLRKQCPRGMKLSLSTIVPYVKQIADALQYAHDERLVHRDIKPENMLLGRNNQILLSDFGIAVVAHGTHSLRTQDAIGTVSYMAPEQLQKKPRPASDQYALGVVVYEWLTGELPFTGAPIEVAMQHLTEEPPSLRHKLPALPAEIEQVVLRALEKDPQKRFESVREFAQTLEQASQGGIAPTIRVALHASTEAIPAKEPVPYQAISVSSQKTKEQWLEEGDQYYDTGRHREAIVAYTQAIILDREDATAYNNRGLAHYELDEDRVALDDYNRAIALDPDSAEIFYNRGCVYDKLNEYQRAIEDLTLAIKLEPTYAEAYNNRGSVYYKLGQYRKAIKDYNLSIELDPTYSSDVYDNRGHVYYILGQYQKAIKDFNRSIEIEPENSAVYYYRGNAYLELQDYHRAIEDYNRAIAMNPNDAPAYNNRGTAYFKLQYYARAIKDYDHSLAIEPDDELVRKNREKAYRLFNTRGV